MSSPPNFSHKFLLVLVRAHTRPHMHAHIYVINHAVYFITYCMPFVYIVKLQF
jgi:hypothetical protein